MSRGGPPPLDTGVIADPIPPKSPSTTKRARSLLVCLCALRFLCSFALVNVLCTRVGASATGRSRSHNPPNPQDKTGMTPGGGPRLR
jgi:hypothetical protein